MTQNTAELQEELSTENSSKNILEDSNDIEAKKLTLYYLIQVDGDPEFRLTAKSARKDGVKAEFTAAGWVYQNRKDAEEVAKRWTQEKRKLRVVPWPETRLTVIWNGSKEESCIAKKSIGLEIDKNRVNEQRKKIEFDCHATRDFHPSWLYASRKNVPKELLKFYDHFKPLFDKTFEEEKEIDLRKADIAREEEDLDEVSDSDDLPFNVIGYNGQRNIIIRHKGRIMYLPARQLNKNDLRLLVGSESNWFKEDGGEELLKNKIVDEAHKKGFINDEEPIRSGIHRIKEKWLIISGKHSAVFEKGSLKTLDDPTYDGRLIECHDADWLDWNALTELLKVNKGNELLKNIYIIIKEKAKCWNWLDATMADYATAFIMLESIHSAMSWRPWIYLTGSKGTGKTTFFEYILQCIYENLVERLDKSTAHATAQTIGNSGRIPIFDEFEKHKHISEVLELAKLFNKGGQKTSGSTSDKAKRYELHHLAWFGSIYLPKSLGQDAAQESRMVKLELKKLNEATPLLDKIDSKDGLKIATEIVAGMILSWDEIEKNAKSINKDRKNIIEAIKGIEIRTVENFMYASALLRIVEQQEEKQTVPIWAARHVEDDGDKIINTILSSIIKHEGSENTVSSALEKINKEEAPYIVKILDQNGLRITSNKGEKYLAIRCDIVTRYLLKDTDFKNYDIQHPLSRIDEAIASHPVKFSGKLERCVLVPLKKIGIEM